MVNDRHAGGRIAWRRRPILPDLIVLAFSLALAGTALPALVAASQTVFADEMLWRLRSGQPAGEADLLRAARGLADAAAWKPSGTLDADRGFVLLKAAEAAPPDRQAALYDAALRATEAGLAQAPANASAWARLAALRLMRQDPGGAVSALKLSFLTGPTVPALTISRLQLTLRLLPQLDPETRSLLDRQIRIAWVLQPAFIADLAGDARYAAVIGSALDALTETERAQYRRLHPRG